MTTGDSGLASPLAAAEGKAGDAALDRALMHGIAWTGAARWFTQILSWLSTLVVARLLTPADYGLVGMATVYLGIVQLANEFGLAAAIVRSQDLDERTAASIGGLSVVLGFLFFAVSVVVAGPVAVFFKQPAVRNIIIVLATTFAASGFRVLPSALLSRDLQFRRLARIDAAGALASTGATLLLALLGFSYWALVLGSVLSTLIVVILTNVARPHAIAWPRRIRPILHHITLGWQVTVTRLAWYAYSNADFAVVGRVLGKDALGAYTFGWELASIPVEKVSAILNQVMLPIFSKVQDDAAALRRFVRGLTEGLAVVTFPMAFGLALVAEPFVRFALGPRWDAAIGPLRLLAFYAAFRSLVTMFPPVLVSVGRARWSMWVSVTLTAVLPVAFYVACRWGTTGVATAWILVYPAVVVPMLVRYTLRAIGMPAGEYLRALWPAGSSSIVMAAAVLGVRQLLPAHLPPGLELGASTAAGAVAYAATLWFGHAGRVRAVIQLVRRQAAGT